MDEHKYSDSASVLAYAQLHGLYDALVIQVDKDFARVNIQLPLGKDTRPEELQTVIRDKIYVLLMERFPDYLNVMYAVDIPERYLKQLALTDPVDVAGQVTFIILKRELQKIGSKEEYKAKNQK